MSKYFSVKSTSCQCGCGWDLIPAFKDTLDAIREAYGKPIGLNGGARCKARNAAVKGAKRSAHIDGVAADLTYTPELLKFIETNLERFNIWMESPKVTGTSRIHIDSRLRVGGRVFFP